MGSRRRSRTFFRRTRAAGQFAEMSKHLEVAIARATGRPPGHVQVSERPALPHQSNRLFDVRVDGRRLIAKEFLKPEEWLESPVREYEALVRLEPFDIVPRPVFFDPDLAPIVIYEYMDGKMWNRRRSSPAELEQLAQVWLKMHEAPSEGMWASRGHTKPLPETVAGIEDKLRAYAQWTSRNHPSASDAAEECLRLVGQTRETANELMALTPAICFCKADPRFASVIRRPDNRLGLVDWEDCGLRDPARDVADMISHPNQEDLVPAGEWRHFLDPYLEERRQQDAWLVERIRLYLGIFPLWWLAILLSIGMEKAQSGALHDWSINGMPASVRLRRLLARAMAWPDSVGPATLSSVADVRFFPDSL